MTAPIETPPAMLVAGDVASYVPNNRWCREGTAVADSRGRLVDTYWSIGNDVLSEAEASTAQVLFNLRDYRDLDHSELNRWEDYSPSDRQVITSQHGLQRRLLVRKGAQPDLATQIDNARQAVADAYEKLRRAGRDVDFARAELARLETDQ